MLFWPFIRRRPSILGNRNSSNFALFLLLAAQNLKQNSYYFLQYIGLIFSTEYVYGFIERYYDIVDIVDIERYYDIEDMKDQMRAPQAVGTVGPWGQVVSSEPEEVRFCRNRNLRMGASC